MDRTAFALAAALLLLLPPAKAAAAPLTPAQALEVVKTIDLRQRSSGDFKALAYMESKEKDKTDVVYELLVYRREAEAKFMILFTKPRAEQGKGYLRLDKNLWMFDPGTGKWERRTERERIGGTDTRRGDLDQSRLAEEYDVSFEKEEKLGSFQVWKLNLKVKEGVDVAFPLVALWVDQATGNVLKRQDLALSGRLMRTEYTPKWKKSFSASKNADVWFPEEMRFFDEVEKANSSLVLIKQIELQPLDPNLFTKAWLEAKSR